MSQKKKKDEPQPTSTIKWVRNTQLYRNKIGYIGTEDVFIFGTGSAITFVRLDADGNASQPDLYYTATKPHVDGVACLVGHPSLPLFAFAEHSNASRMFIVQYPDFRQLCTMFPSDAEDGAVGAAASQARKSRRILSMAFSETEHLAVLTGYPSFALEVWNWRTQRRLIEQPTGVVTDLQRIKLFATTPLTITQIASTTGELCLWELHLGVDSAALIKRRIPIPGESQLHGPFDLTFRSDLGIFITNRTKRIWSVNIATRKITQIIGTAASAGADQQNDSALVLASEKPGQLSRMSRMSAFDLFDGDSDENRLRSIVAELPQQIVFLKTYRKGLLLIDAQGVLRLYLRSATTLEWYEDFSFECGENIVASSVMHKQTLVVFTEKGRLRMLVDVEQKSGDGDGVEATKAQRYWVTIRDYDRCFKMLAIINPLGEHIVTVNKFNCVNLVRVATGQIVDTLRETTTHILGNITCISSYRTLPVIVIGNSYGMVHLFSLYSGKAFEVMASFHLTDWEIVRLVNWQDGNVIVAVDETNTIFLIKGQLGGVMSVCQRVPIVDNIISMAIYNWSNVTTVLALTVPLVAPAQRHSDRLVRIQFTGDEYMRSECWLPKAYMVINWLWPNAEADDYEALLDHYVMVPHLSNNFEVIRLTDMLKQDVDDAAEGMEEEQEEEDVEVVDDEASGGECDRHDDTDIVLVVEVLHVVQTIHRVCKVQLRMYADFILTWAQDGVVQVWNKRDFTPYTHVLAMNPYAVGVQWAVTDHFRQYFVTLGFEGNLQCQHHTPNAVDNSKLFIIRQFLASKATRDQFANPTIGVGQQFNAPDGDTSATPVSWVRQQEQQRLAAERLQFADERQAISVQLAELCDKVRTLIDANERAPDDEQLDIADFDLDAEGTARRTETARLARLADDAAIRAECDRLAAQTAAITERTYDRMAVKGKQLRGIRTKLKVENYGMLQPDAGHEAQVQRAKLWRHMERVLSTEDTFQPWWPHEYEMLKRQVQRKPVFADAPAGDEELGEGSVGGGDESSVSSSTVQLLPKDTHQYSLSGTSSHTYIVPLETRYGQLEVVSYYQMMVENIFGQEDAIALRRYFNERFEQMSTVKAHEIRLCLQRNDRLREIQSELNKLEALKFSAVVHERDIVDPTYEPDEQPERIVRVEPDELSVSPYVSPSEQALIDAAAAEAERRRLAMLADDFRERALMRMMNGVLEVRWEDEIKKVPPEPECVRSGKNPKDYTPEDLGAILDYERLVEFLIAERARYAVMLNEEQERIEREMFEQIKKFNLRVAETLWEKIRVEFAIAGEDMKRLRNQLFNWERLRFADQQRELENDIKDLNAGIDHLLEVLANIETSLASCRAKYEELTTRDRLLDRHFKIGFSEFAAKAVVDQAYRLFRRRPAWQTRAWQTASILFDIAKRIATADYSPDKGCPLPAACFQYLQQCEAIDRPANAPNVLDEKQWRNLCRMRRIKLEMEFRVRAVGAQVADAEATVAAFQKEIAARRSKLARVEALKAELVVLRDEHMVDRTVQLCLKRGQVEIALSGHVRDFANAILLHSSDIHDINAIIRKAGAKKLKTMENAAVFRRKITFKEWEHRVLRLKIEEKRIAIKCIQRCKITKEVQKWLKWKRLGWKEDISETALARNIEASRLKLEAMCNEIIRKINETNATIAEKRQTNRRLDRQILTINLDVAELQLARDLEAEAAEVRVREQRLAMMTRRSRLVREIQRNHSRIVELCTILELQRLRTFPTLTRMGPLSARDDGCTDRDDD